MQPAGLSTRHRIKPPFLAPALLRSCIVSMTLPTRLTHEVILRDSTSCLAPAHREVFTSSGRIIRQMKTVTACTYYMKMVKSCNMAVDCEVPGFLEAVDNVMKWGLGGHLDKVANQLKIVWAAVKSGS